MEFENRSLDLENKMGWSYPDITIEDLVDRIKGFVDILVLASGYQSSGLPANWDVENIKKALRWGLFFEDVMKSLLFSGKHEESVKVLDAALSHLTSDPNFPLGLVHMSSATLSNARRLVLEHFLLSHHILDKHLVAFLSAVVEMDIDEISESYNDCPKAYFDRLTLQMESLDIVAAGRNIAHEVKTSLPVIDPIALNCSKHIDKNLYTPLRFNGENKKCICVDNSFFVIKDILNRQSIMSCMSSIEKGLNDLSDVITRNNLMGSAVPWKSADSVSSNEDQMLTELYRFNHWRSRCLSYLLDKRTIKLLSGAQLILKAPKEQWVRVFEGLKTSNDSCHENLLEILEILLLGLISSKCNYMIQHLMYISCDFLSISKKLSMLHELVQGNSPAFHSNKESDILGYLTPLLSSLPHKLWKIPSVLVAAAIPSWSTLFRTHLREVENHYDESYLTRCHGCCQNEIEHQDCQAAERIQSFYALHIQCSPGRARAAGVIDNEWRPPLNNAI